MDKRYLLILIIIIVCCINLSILVVNSDIVGSASANAGKYLFSIPEGFSLHENRGNTAIIQNDNGMKISLESDINDSDEEYNNLLDRFENRSDVTILSEGTINVENITVNAVYFYAKDNNKSAYYFEKDNSTFKLIMSNFNYEHDRDLTLDYATLIIKSVRFDYKSK